MKHTFEDTGPHAVPDHIPWKTGNKWGDPHKCPKSYTSRHFPVYDTRKEESKQSKIGLLIEEIENRMWGGQRDKNWWGRVLKNGLSTKKLQISEH